MACADHETKKWTRTPADEKAASNGCRFDESRGRFVIDWIEKYCRLYEGERAGEPLRLLDWQQDCVLRLFSWVRWSEKWEREVRRFRQASILVAKKNGKSPTLAAIGWFLLAGDGEPGQKVFLAAKDGKQAREIAGRHAVEMLLQSEELLSECTINRNLLLITHLPTRSIMMPLSSSNSRTQESKEGLNGSVLIDETHVVDRDFVRRISRAGISRSEPLQVEVSTAGSDPDGYGAERFTYAQSVLAGVTVDQEFFAAVYAAPQDLADADLDGDPLKYAAMANPALGRLVDPQEVIADYTRSKKSLRALGDFRQYRLNIWQRTATPWIRASDWELCRREYTLADLAGKDCWAALDLSRTRDMSALVLIFQGEGEEEYFLWPTFWLPEKRIADLESLASFAEWVRGGWLNATPGDVIDYGYIREKIREIAAGVNLIELAYDPRFAEETTAAIEQGVSGPDGKVLEEGLGVPRVVFPQNDVSFAAPVEDFERLIIAGKLHHPGNPVLTWQVGHACVIVRPLSKCRRVVKPRGGDGRTIDGVIAAIMALGRCRLAEAAPTGGGGFETW
jgi:phage terminase large subunit-like protein